MSQKAAFQALVGKILDGFGDVVESVSYSRDTKGPVDPVLGQTKTTSTSTVRGVFSPYSTNTRRPADVTASGQQRAFADETAGDLRFTCAAVELGFRPLPLDRVVRSGVTYVVIAYVTDPAEAAYNIQVRPA